MPTVSIPNADVEAAQRIGNDNFVSTLREVAWRRFMAFYCPQGRDDRSLWHLSSCHRAGSDWIVTFDPVEPAVPSILVSVDATRLSEGTDYVQTGLVVVFAQTPAVDSPVRIRRNGRENVTRGNGIQNVFLMPHDPQREHLTAREHELLQTGVHPAAEPGASDVEALTNQIAETFAVPRDLLANAPSTDFRRTIACTQGAIDQRLTRVPRDEIARRTRAEVAEYLIREGSDLSMEEWRAVEHRQTGDGYRITFERNRRPINEVMAEAERAIQTVEEAVFGATPAARDIGTWTGTFAAVQDYALGRRLVGRPISDVVMRMAREQLGPTRRVVLQPECDMPHQVWRVQHVPVEPVDSQTQVFVNGILLNAGEYTVNIEDGTPTVRLNNPPAEGSVVQVSYGGRVMNWRNSSSEGTGARVEFEQQPPTIETIATIESEGRPDCWTKASFTSSISHGFIVKYALDFGLIMSHTSVVEIVLEMMKRIAGCPITILNIAQDSNGDSWRVDWVVNFKDKVFPKPQPLKLKTRRREVEPRAILAEEVPEE